MKNLEQKTNDYFKVELKDFIPLYGFFRYTSRVQKSHFNELKRVTEGPYKLMELREEFKRLDSTKNSMSARRLGLYIFHTACFFSGVYGALSLFCE